MAYSIKNLIMTENGRKITMLAVSAIALTVSFFAPEMLPVNPAWVAIVLCGIPILIEAVEGVFTRFDIKADVLVSIALIAAIFIDEIFAAGEVAFIMQIGEFLEDRTVAKARAGIEKLIKLTPVTARVIKDGGEKIVTVDMVQVGDILRVLPGEQIPVDGVVYSGTSSVNEAVMTGESLPVDKFPGDELFSGSVNQFGAFEMRATKSEADSSIQRMVKLVQAADAGKARIVTLADRWATWIVIAALVSAAGVWLWSGEIIRAVTILVVFCPCALVLATPTAIMAGIGNATRHGILVRQGDALERLARVRRVVLDKTGTLTHGVPEVVGCRSFLNELSGDGLFRLAGAAESRSEHPLGKAIVEGCRKDGLKLPEPEAFKICPGRGVIATVENKKIIAGNAAFLLDNAITVSEDGKAEAERYLADGATVIFLGIDGQYAGMIALADGIRENTANMVKEFKTIGIKIALLTGDHWQAAKNIAARAGIDDLHAECLPEDKLKAIDNYQASGEPVCMIGDGVNDAPALKRAQVGIAMGGIGSDIAIEAADITLVNDDITQLPFLFRLARRSMTTIKLNLTFSMVLNFVAIVLAGCGILNPVVGALVHNAGSVLVIANSALLLNYKCRK
ncbi:MAG: heavy metal translocating P-type ATPase [Victivallaceae bacterium]